MGRFAIVRLMTAQTIHEPRRKTYDDAVTMITDLCIHCQALRPNTCGRSGTCRLEPTLILHNQASSSSSPTQLAFVTRVGHSAIVGGGRGELLDEALVGLTFLRCAQWLQIDST